MRGPLPQGSGLSCRHRGRPYYRGDQMLHLLRSLFSLLLSLFVFVLLVPQVPAAMVLCSIAPAVLTDA